MKKLLLAVVMALTAGAASAGTIEFKNEGWFSISTYSPGFDGNVSVLNSSGAILKTIHETDPAHDTSGSGGIIYDSHKEFTVRFAPQLVGYNHTPIKVGVNDKIKVTYYGTIFNPQYGVEYDHYQ